ncbi:HI1506-related protein [Oricola sp.]|uniref:HI1506-related protein n=1 Tax=Oricola sp. TaxID=1979950 RepID=UPI0025F248E5|nr:HI1506-related protein [Oricola sp.]MCI5075555.1 HI1506-related protein [Oricola sp.]
MAKAPASKKDDEAVGTDAKAAADKLIADAKEEAAQITADAKAKADKALEDATKVAEESSAAAADLIVKVKAEAETVIADAKAAAARIVEEARAGASAPEPVETPPAATTDMKGGVRIRSKIDGFRRAGVAHPKDATEYPAGTFSTEQIKVLKGEPNLVVEDL